jgi:tetrahydromethanopterin S-methyltransferase subunit G
MSSDNLDTRPRIETVLERINELGARLETRIGGLDTRIGTLENAVTELRDEMHHGFRDMERRLEAVGGEIIKIRADLSYVHDRIDKIEKAS